MRVIPPALPFSLAFVFLATPGISVAAERQESNSLGMTLHLIEGGRFLMGTDARQRGLERDFPLSVNAQFYGNAETPAHITWITRPYWIAETEVTVGQWKAFVADTGHVTTAEKNGEGIIGWSPTPEDTPLYQSHDFERKPEFTWKNPGFPQEDSHPVVGVSWEDVQAFLGWLSKKEGVTYRLPTEAEWEFACRAGTDTWFSFGDQPRNTVHRHANLGNVELEKHRKNAAERQWLLDWKTAPQDGHIFTAPVGSFEPNAFGLRDLHGNVWEWCADLWLDTFYQHWDWPQRGQPRGVAIDPVNESEPQTKANQFRAIRGGSWYNGPIVCRSSGRTYWDEPDAACYLGFRVVREADPAISMAAKEALEAEQHAREAIENGGGSFQSNDGLSLTVELGGEALDTSALEALALIPEIETLVLQPKKNHLLTSSELEAISRVSGLRRLNFRSSFEIAEADLSLLAKLPKLEELAFSRSTGITNAHLEKLSELRSLKSFQAYGTSGEVTDEGIAKIAGNRSLETLEISETKASGAFLKAFAECPLTSLTFTGTYQGEATFTDELAKELASFPQLTRLFLNGQKALTEQTIAVIGSLEDLDELGLHGCTGISPTGFDPLGELTKLRTLNLQGTTAGDEAIAGLTRIPRIQGLRIGGDEATITDVGFASLSELFSLESLYIENSQASDNGLVHLGRINRLKQLDIGSPKVTGSGLGPIARLPELNDLRLRCPALTDVVFEQMARAKSLRKLRLVERGWQPPAALTNEGLLAIARANWLTELWLPRNDSGLTEEGMKALEPLMPKTNVIPYSVEWKERSDR